MCVCVCSVAINCNGLVIASSALHQQIDALSEIVDTVQGRIEVYLDGGIRTGSDVLKALALGAKCVFIGRPAVWGLAYKVLI